MKAALSVAVLPDDGHGRVDDERVVDGLRKIVLPCRLGEVGLDLQVDLEGLRRVLLAGECAVAAQHPQPA